MGGTQSGSTSRSRMALAHESGAGFGASFGAMATTKHDSTAPTKPSAKGGSPSGAQRRGATRRAARPRALVLADRVNTGHLSHVYRLMGGS
jgi:hypothetical protein